MCQSNGYFKSPFLQSIIDLYHTLEYPSVISMTILDCTNGNKGTTYRKSRLFPLSLCLSLSLPLTLSLLPSSHPSPPSSLLPLPPHSTSPNQSSLPYSLISIITMKFLPLLLHFIITTSLVHSWWYVISHLYANSSRVCMYLYLGNESRVNRSQFYP